MSAPDFLADIRIVSVALQFPGPFATKLLADLGASVIQIEPPRGDPTRRWPAFFDGVNRSKKSIIVDLKRPEGQEIAHRLAQSSHLFFEGFRPGVASRLGLSWEDLHGVNPAIVYCSISGYGQTGSRAQLSGHDINYAAASGLLDLNRGPDGDPRNHGLPIGDVASGMMAALSAIAALHGARATGKGVFIDLSMAEVLVSMLGTELSAVLATGTHRPSEPAYGVFRTADGEYLALGIGHEDHFWKALCGCINMDQSDWGLSSDERIADRIRLRGEVEKRLAEGTLSHWITAFSAKGVPCSRVNNVGDLAQDAYLNERMLLGKLPSPNGEAMQVCYPALFNGMRPTLRGRVPYAGQDTRQVLIEAGYTEEHIDKLVEGGVVADKVG